MDEIAESCAEPSPAGLEVSGTIARRSRRSNAVWRAAVDSVGASVTAPPRKWVAAAVIGALVAFSGGVAAGSVPKANWYWTMVLPSSSPKVLLLGTSSGLYRSSDGGKTWHAAGFTDVNATSLVRAGNTLFLGGVREKPGAGPTVTEHGDYYVSSGQGVLEASTNAGRTWQALHPSGLPNLEVAALAVDPASSGALYAVLRSGAVYRSSDGARSFQLVTAKIGGTPWALAVTQDNHLVDGDMSTGAYLSTNGTAWVHTAFVDPRGSYMVMEYAVDPTDPSRVLMTSYGVVASTDGGASWRQSLKSKVMFGPVAWAPSTPGVAYAVGFDGSLWRTDDSGVDWTEVS
jgi:hypothetical protein